MYKFIRQKNKECAETSWWEWEKLERLCVPQDCTTCFGSEYFHPKALNSHHKWRHHRSGHHTHTPLVAGGEEDGDGVVPGKALDNLGTAARWGFVEDCACWEDACGEVVALLGWLELINGGEDGLALHRFMGWWRRWREDRRCGPWRASRLHDERCRRVRLSPPNDEGMQGRVCLRLHPYHHRQRPHLRAITGSLPPHPDQRSGDSLLEEGQNNPFTWQMQVCLLGQTFDAMYFS
jgi:hypothetical protein